MSRILIVEDNEKNMKLLRDVLGFKKHEVLEAVDGETGVTMATEQMPDLVLMDIQLPGINGVEALRQLRANPATAKIDSEKVIVTSPAVKTPVAVRYAWKDDPKANLVNSGGLPASPFRSDAW